METAPFGAVKWANVLNKSRCLHASAAMETAPFGAVKRTMLNTCIDLYHEPQWRPLLSER